MTTSYFRQRIESLLEGTDVEINGSRAWDIRVHNEAFFARVLAGGSLAFGESYMDGWWDCERLDELMTRLLRADLEARIQTLGMTLDIVRARMVNRQAGTRAYVIGERHYDTGNDLFEAMLDKRMTYTCGYWKNAKNLDDAQRLKLDLVCKKIGLKKGDHVLDIGCGWGSFLIYAAQTYGIRGTGITVSKEQFELACLRSQGLPIEIRMQDYREVSGVFDHVVSLGMFEHVGVKNYHTFMNVVKRMLAPNGLFLLHTIGKSKATWSNDPWIEKYIFPNSIVPSIGQVATASEGLFVMEDWHNFSTHYDLTLMAWYANVERAWDQLLSRYSERFRRMWSYYLLSSTASFRCRKSQLWQIVFSHHGREGGYERIS